MELLTEEQAAFVTGHQVDTIRNYIAAGRLETTDWRGERLIRTETLSMVFPVIRSAMRELDKKWAEEHAWYGNGL